MFLFHNEQDQKKAEFLTMGFFALRSARRHRIVHSVFHIFTFYFCNYKYSIKRQNIKKKYSIKNGRISKLSARINYDWIFNYDRGWDIKPQEKIAKKALKMLVKKYK